MENDIEHRLKKLQDLIDIQASDGNWNYDNYMHGLLNGMYLARSVFDDNYPGFKDPPNLFIKDKEILDKINNGGISYEKNSTSDSNEI